MVLSQNKKDAGVYCCARSCKNKPLKKLGGLCPKHYRRKRRGLDPVYCRYNGFKGNAKRRRVEFFVKLKEFRFWCNFTGYIITKGKRGQNATIDRRCNAHGYYIWNMQLLSNRRNAKKGGSFSGSIFTREHHFGKDQDLKEWKAAGEDLPF